MDVGVSQGRFNLQVESQRLELTYKSSIDARDMRSAKCFCSIVDDWAHPENPESVLPI